MEKAALTAVLVVKWCCLLCMYIGITFLMKKKTDLKFLTSIYLNIKVRVYISECVFEREILKK